MRFNRKFRRSLRRLLLAGAVAGAAWVPATAVASNGSQLSGQTSAVTHEVARYSKSGDVYLGARAVPMPSTGYSRIVGVVGVAAHQKVVQTTRTASATNGFDWRAATIAIASAFAACVLVAGAYAVRRRTRLTPA